MFGDNHSLENLVTACYVCNQLKGHYFPKHLHNEKEIMHNIREHIGRERARDFERYVETVVPFINNL